jgi:hypothetical protein
MPANTPIFGFPYPLGTDPVAQGDNDIRDLAEDVETVINNQVGLRLVRSQNFTASDPLDLTGIFSSSYVNYKIYVTYFGSVAGQLTMQMFSGTNTLFTGSAYFRYGFAYTAGGSFTNQAVSGANFLGIAQHVTSASQQTSMEMTFFHPNSNSQRKYIHSNWFDANTGGMNLLQMQVVDNTAFTGIRLDAASGSITGQVRVYGLKD